MGKARFPKGSDEAKEYMAMIRQIAKEKREAIASGELEPIDKPKKEKKPKIVKEAVIFKAKEEAEMALAKKGVMKSINEKLVIIRAKRDMLLAKSDYMFLVPDAVIDDKIIKYRQELRDFPNKIVNGMFGNDIHILSIPDDEIISYFPKI